MSLLTATIRRAEPSETERLVEIALAAWDRDLRPFLSGTAANPAAERRRMQHAVHDLLGRTIVAETEDGAVGWCARARTRAYVPFLFVDPVWQSRGIGTLLLGRTETLLELEGAERVQLDTLSDNVRAVAFYQHQGYRILALKRDGGGRDPELNVRLEKRLTPFRGPVDEDE